MHYPLLSKRSPYFSPPVAKLPPAAKGEKFGYFNKKYVIYGFGLCFVWSFLKIPFLQSAALLLVRRVLCSQ